MARRLRSASLALISAAFVAGFCVLALCDLLRPEPYGYAATFRAGRMVITAVDGHPESLATRSGLRAGDVVIAANGRRVDGEDDWAFIEATLDVSQPLRLTLQRGSDTLERPLVFSRAGARFWASPPGVVLLITLAVQCVALVLATVVVVRRPTDPVALVGAWALFTVAIYVIVLPYRFGAVWRALPVAVGGLLWPPFVCGQAAAAVLCTFFLSFPRRTIRSPLLWAGLWTPIAVAVARPVVDAWRLTSRTTDLAHLTVRHVSFGVTFVYVITGLAVLVWNYLHLTDVNERRRVRIVVVGAVCGLMPGLIVIAGAHLGSEPSVTASIFTSPIMAVGTLTLLLFPVSLTYAILRHRVFDVRLIIRQSVRYAVARGALLSLVPALALGLIVDVLWHGDAPLLAVLRARGWMYAAIAAMATLAHVRRVTWLVSLDRRFFREQYHAQRVLAQIAEDIRHLSDFDTVAPRVVAHIADALHPEFVSTPTARGFSVGLHSCCRRSGGARASTVASGQHVSLPAAAASGPARDRR